LITTAAPLAPREQIGYLHDYTCAVAETHAEITTRDNHYCLIDRSGRTRINSGTEYIGLNRIIQINEGDLLHIGKYRIKVRFHEVRTEHIAGSGWHEGAGLSELAGQKKHIHTKGHLLAHAVDDEIPLIDPDNCLSHDVENSILINAIPEEILDPLAAFSKPITTARAYSEDAYNDHSTFAGMKYNSRPKKGYTNDDKAVKDKFSGNITIMNDSPKPPEDLNQSEQYYSYPKSTELDHIIIAPLLRGMGISIEEMDAESAHEFLIEVGQAIRVTITGIQALYQQDQSTAINPYASGSKPATH